MFLNLQITCWFIFCWLTNYPSSTFFCPYLYSFTCSRRLFLSQPPPLPPLLCQNTEIFLQPQHLAVEPDSAFLWDGRQRTMWTSFICFFTSCTNITKRKRYCLCLSACLMMVATDHQHPLSGSQVCGGALLPLWSVTEARRGPGWSGLGTCRGRALAPSLPLYPTPQRTRCSHHQMGAGSEF